METAAAAQAVEATAAAAKAKAASVGLALKPPYETRVSGIRRMTRPWEFYSFGLKRVGGQELQIAGPRRMQCTGAVCGACL